MADIQYLNYGDLQIELLALLTNLANNVQDYVNNLSWSTKRKEKFMSAYSDLMNRGILGASNSTGLWTIKVKGEDIPFETMSKKDKEMYEEAAYFIQQQMAGLPTKSSQEEEAKKKKEELPVFDNFDSNFKHYVGKTFFGGNNFNIGGELDEWNYLDERNPNTGLRGTSKRAEKLAEYLQSYSNSLKEDLYNFENSPFLDLNDLKSRILTAIQALKTSDPNDDRGALNAIGLKSADWFYNGSGDAYKNGEYEGTYGDYYNTYLPELERKKQEEESAKLKAQQEEYLKNKLYFTTHKSKLFGKDLNYLANKYLNELNLVTALNNYVSRGIGNLNGEELSELVGSFKYGALDPISDEELKAFRTYSPVFKNATKNQFRKFRGVEGAFFHVPSGKVYTFGTRDLVSPTSSTTGDILKGRSDKDKLLAYLQNTEFTDADWAELAGIGLDIASIVDPEPWSAGTMGVLAAGARNYARVLQPEDWGFLDYLSQGADYVTGALGAAPLLGDSVLLAKVVKSAGPWLRKAMRVPAFLDLWNSTPGMVEFGKKLFSGETDKLTVEDWRNFGTFIRGLATTRNLNVTNRAARRALEKRGIETTNKWHLRLGLTRTKPLSETTTPTIRVKVNDKVEEISITPERKAKLEEELNGKTEAERADVLKKSKEVLDFIKDKKVKPEDVLIVLDKSKLNTVSEFKIFGKRPLSRVGGRGVFGEKPTSTTRGTDTFDKYVGPAPTTWTDRFRITGNRGFWDRLWYGSNTTLRGMDRLNNIKPIENTQNNAKPKDRPILALPNKKPILALPNKKPLVSESPIRRIDISSKLNVRNFPPLPRRTKMNLFKDGVNEIKLFERAYGNGQMRNTGYGDINYNNLEKSINPKELTFELPGGKKITFKVSQNDLKNVTPNKINEIRLKHAKLVRDLIKNLPAKVIGPLLKELKKNGFLKLGGKIDRQRIQRYKEYINK